MINALKVNLVIVHNPNSLEVNCTRIQVPSLSTGSVPQRSCHPQFKYSVFYLPSSKVKVFRGFPCQTPDSPSKKKCDSNFESPFIMSSVEDDHLGKLDELGDHSLKEPLETNLNDLF